MTNLYAGPDGQLYTVRDDNDKITERVEALPIAAMSQALDRAKGLNLIEQIEQQTGQRWDSNGGDNKTLTTLFGAMSRLLSEAENKPHHRAEDDYIAGALVQHELSSEGRAQRKADEQFADALCSGIPIDLFMSSK